MNLWQIARRYYGLSRVPWCRGHAMGRDLRPGCRPVAVGRWRVGMGAPAVRRWEVCGVTHTAHVDRRPQWSYWIELHRENGARGPIFPMHLDPI